MKPLISYLLAALVAGALLFGWGYRRGAASVTVRDSVSVRLKPMPPVTVTIREPWPVAVHEPADTVWQTIPADTGAIIADYLRTRDYHFDFSSDSTGRFIVDASVSRNRLMGITPTIVPIIREDHYPIFYKTQHIRRDGRSRRWIHAPRFSAYGRSAGRDRTVEFLEF